MEESLWANDRNDCAGQIRIGLVVQARMGSTRLPGKVLLNFNEGLSILHLIVKSVELSGIGIPIIVATGDNKENQAIVSFCRDNRISCFIGDENNVLQRFIDCANHYNFDYIIRICADNPFLEPYFLKQLFDSGCQMLEMDYVGFKIDQETPSIKSHWGLFAEWVKVKALKQTAFLTKDSLFTEHVTNFLYQNPEKFKLHWLKAPDLLWQKPQLRFTIDSMADFKNMQHLFTLFNETKGVSNYQKLIQLASGNGEIISIMNDQINNQIK